MIINQKITNLQEFVLCSSYLYPKKYTEVMNQLPDFEKNIIKDFFNIPLSSPNFYNPGLKNYSSNTKPIASGFSTPDFKALLGNYYDPVSGSLKNILSIGDELCNKYCLSKEKFINILISYLKTLYKIMEQELLVLQHDFFKSLQNPEVAGSKKEAGKCKILSFSDFAFFSPDIITTILDKIDFSDYIFLAYRQKEPIKAFFIKSLFEKYNEDMEKTFMLMEDIIFTGPMGAVNLVLFEERTGTAFTKIKSIFENNKDKLPAGLVFPSQEYINRKIKKISKLCSEKTNSLKITDLLYTDTRCLARFINNEELDDKAFYALLYKYRNTELAYKISSLLTKEFKNEIPKYNVYFQENPEEAELDLGRILATMKKMSDEQLIWFYTNGLYLTESGEVIFMNKNRHIEKYDIQDI